MTIFQHAAHGALLALLVTHSIPLIILAAIVGALPDIIGAVGRWKNHNWDWYLWAHQPHWFFYIIPPIVFHQTIDFFWHKPEGGWQDWGLKGEIIGWIITIVCFLLIIL